jgi:PadR family transcriptional regulator PadR
MNTANNITTQIRKGLLDFFILATLKNKSKYPREIIEELNHYGLSLVEGTIYPLFLRLHKNKLVKYEWIEAAGHPRKYYSLTTEGLEVLKQYEKEWETLHSVLNKIQNSEAE